MTKWLLDASVILASEDLGDPHRDDALRLLEGDVEIATLDLAYYEVSNVAVRAWHDPGAATRLRDRVTAIADDGGLVRADARLLTDATAAASEHDLSAYDAAYVAAARAADANLVSCDIRDLVSRGLAILPSAAV